MHWSKHPEIEYEIKLVNEIIEKNLSSRNMLLSSVVKDLLRSGGKRLRPALAILSAKQGTYDSDKAIRVAAALEVLHTATLVHDDIIDRADTRRGKETVSHKYGADMAVYVGDYLLSRSVIMLSEGIPAQQLLDIAKAIKSICEGEVDQYQDRRNPNISVAGYLKRIGRKTAVLFSASCAAGAFSAGCSKGTIRQLYKFGLNYGMAFQIRDDLNDYLSDKEASGKPVANDITAGVVTLPVIFGMRRNQEINGMVKRLADADHSASAWDVANFAELVRKSGGVEESAQLLGKYVQRGLKALQPLPPSLYKEILTELIMELA